MSKFDLNALTGQFDLVGGGSSVGIGTPISGANPDAVLITDSSSNLADSGTMTDGQVIIGRTGNTPVRATLTGTANQVIVTNGSGSITLSTPQNIGTASNVTFGSVDTGTIDHATTLNIGTASATTINLGGAGTTINVPGTTPFANKALSNLTSPTSVNQNLIPDADNTRNLGSATKAWTFGYMDEIHDHSDNRALDVTSRLLCDTSDRTSVDFTSRTLQNSSATALVDWSGTDPSLNAHKLTSVADPASAQDAATKFYVDNLVAGLTWKNPAQAASTANVNLASMSSTLDGYSLISGDRFLAKDQTTASENGIYIFNGAGSAATRSTDADSWNEIVGAVLLVINGTANAGSKWVNSNVAGGTIGVTSVTFVAFSIAGTVNGTGTTNQVTYWTGTSTIAGENALSNTRGGLGTDASAFTGVVKAAAGSFSASTIVNTDINAAAAIALSKLVALSTNKALQSDGSGIISASTVTSTELGYSSGVTSAIQTQIDGKANTTLSNLTSPTAINQSLIPGGLFNLGTATNSWSAVHADNLTKGSSQPIIQLGPTNVAGLFDATPTLSVDWPNRQLTSGATIKLDWSGTDPSLNSHKLTNVTDPTSAQDAATKNYVDTNLPATVTGDISQTSFSGANNVASPTNVTGLAFANGTVRSFRAQLSVFVNATSPLYESFELQGIQRASDWLMSVTSTGDTSGVVFSITTAGQVQYTDNNYTGFTALTMRFRATVTSV